MIDIRTETLVPLHDACKLIPPGRNGRRTHLSTLLRWILKGSKGPEGQTVRLEGVRIGGRWLTSREALQRFAEGLTPHPSDEKPPNSPRTPTQRRRADEHADEELRQLGI